MFPSEFVADLRKPETILRELFIFNTATEIPAVINIFLRGAPAGARWSISPSNGTIQPQQFQSVVLQLFSDALLTGTRAMQIEVTTGNVGAGRAFASDVVPLALTVTAAADPARSRLVPLSEPVLGQTWTDGVQIDTFDKDGYRIEADAGEAFDVRMRGGDRELRCSSAWSAPSLAYTTTCDVPSDTNRAGLWAVFVNHTSIDGALTTSLRVEARASVLIRGAKRDESLASRAQVPMRCDATRFDVEDVCENCITGMQCETDASVGNVIGKVALLAGFWRSSTLSWNVRACPLKDACLPSSNITDAICADGFIGPTCAACDVGYFQSTAHVTCVPCGGSSDFGVTLVFALPMLAGLVALACMARFARRGYVCCDPSKSALKAIFTELQEVRDRLGNQAATADDVRQRLGAQSSFLAEKAGRMTQAFREKAQRQIANSKLLLCLTQLVDAFGFTYDIGWPAPCECCVSYSRALPGVIA